MKYTSTRGKAEEVSAAEAIVKGLATDGGLYLPSDEVAPYPEKDLPGGTYQDIAKIIFKRFLTDYSGGEIEHAVHAAYNRNNFDHAEITPLTALSSTLFIAELWHGPTAAFKDIALQVLPHLLGTAVLKTGERAEIVILTATSGDTGKSALEGFRDVPGVKIMVYFPGNGVSEVQKRQMTTQQGSNLSVAAVKGNFDHAQAGVKQIFNDRDLATQLKEAGYLLSSANSINWGRLLPQIVYYFYTYGKMIARKAISPGDKVNFCVPTGNFGNILAGYYAMKLGLPVHRLICAANFNNVLSIFINTGRYNSRRSLYQTTSPSMDILVSSNLERLLFLITGQDAEKVNAWMQELKQRGEYSVDKATLEAIREQFRSDFAGDEEAAQAISSVYREHGYLMDTHTAVGKAVLEKYQAAENDHRPTVILSTASPFKFTGSVVRALYPGEDFAALTEFDLIKVLAKRTGIPAPDNLVNLDRLEIKHKQVVAPAEMRNHLLSFLGL